MSYQPQFCYQNRYRNYPGCQDPLDFWRGSLTMHGLWPNYNDGSYPSTCSNEPFDPQTVKTIGADEFNTYWPNVKVSKTSPELDSFWEHEWTKHGTCSGLDQVDYFKTSLGHFLPTPDIVRERYGKTVSKEELMDAYGGDVIFTCSHGRYLSEVRTCVGRSPDGTATKSIDCIPQVEHSGNCDDEIHITKFYIDNDDEL